MKKILISEFMDDEVVDALRSAIYVQYEPDLEIRRVALIHAINDAKALKMRASSHIAQRIAETLAY